MICKEVKKFNGSKYCYVSQNNSIKLQAFVYTQLNDQTVLFQTISISHLFAIIVNVKQFYLTHRWQPIRYYHSVSEETWEQW